ncbi:hypothetical protein [Paludibacter jiangxiensis]|uniref:Uncharacterized protein n=1 Tax=Paludibacter jiangxiensis TaxID=681398 RepID=A0A161M5C5_9BACT|nr:hypothetical protein [Paludibacter jiangxiensis]GAT63533.1 hypothetical protein PJIAN_471 [Paludibacter jiangxiensis]
MKTRMLTILLVLTFGCNTEAQSLFDDFNSPKKEENTTDFYKSKSDSILFNMGFYKIKNNDSIYHLIKNKKIESLVDYSTCNHSTINSIKYKLKETLDGVDQLLLNSSDSILHTYLSRNHSYRYFSTDLKDKKIKSSSMIAKDTYYLFPQPWFGVQTEDSLKVRNQFTIKLVSFSDRGDYMKIICENDLLPQSTLIYEYIQTVFTSIDSLSVLVWFPNTDIAYGVPTKKISDILKKAITKNTLKFKEDFKSFPDTTLTACISYKAHISKEGQQSKERPILELFFTTKNCNNTLIISNGYQYAGYEFTNINKLRRLFNKMFLKKQ